MVSSALIGRGEDGPDEHASLGAAAGRAGRGVHRSQPHRPTSAAGGASWRAARAAIDSMQRVPECQSPLYLSVEVTDDSRVRLYFDAPPEAVTTRGLAAILHTGLDGEPAAIVLGTPDDFYLQFGLADAVSPLRLRGAAAMLARIKRTVRGRA